MNERGIMKTVLITGITVEIAKRKQIKQIFGELGRRGRALSPEEMKKRQKKLIKQGTGILSLSTYLHKRTQLALILEHLTLKLKA